MIFTSSLQITVVTLSGYQKSSMLALWSTGPGNVAFEVENPKDMVDKVIARSKEVGAPAQRLNIISHGSSRSINIGAWYIDHETIQGCLADLARLKAVMSGESLIHLMGCEIGQNHKLLQAIAKATGVPVYAGTGVQNTLLRVQLGDYVRAMPGGSVEEGVSRP